MVRFSELTDGISGEDRLQYLLVYARSLPWCATRKKPGHLHEEDRDYIFSLSLYRLLTNKETVQGFLF